jgi:hypothetical protein
MTRLSWWFALAGVTLVAACGGGSAPPDPATYFASPTPYATAACNAVDGELMGQREMKLFQSGAVDTVGVTQGLQRYYRRHSLTFFTNQTAQDAGTSYALDTNETALGAALVRAFPNVDFSTDASAMADPVVYQQILTFAANFILRPMIDFAKRNAAGPDVTNLVLIPDLERPGGEKLGDPGTSLAGLAISPPLLAEFMRTMPDEGKIWQNVQLPAGFTPMMFLGYKVLNTVTLRDPALRDLVVAHEFGHTGGLVHTDVPLNLMFPSVAPGRDTCQDSLDATQLATMRTNLNLTSARTGALSVAPPRAPGAELRAAAPRFTPTDLRAMLAGDARAWRLFLRPLLDAMVLDPSAANRDSARQCRVEP